MLCLPACQRFRVAVPVSGALSKGPRPCRPRYGRTGSGALSKGPEPCRPQVPRAQVGPCRYVAPSGGAIPCRPQYQEAFPRRRGREWFSAGVAVDGGREQGKRKAARRPPWFPSPLYGHPGGIHAASRMRWTLVRDHRRTLATPPFDSFTVDATGGMPWAFILSAMAWSVRPSLR